MNDPARIEAGHKRLFDSIPVGILEQDYSGVKRYIDELRAGGVQDLRDLFTRHPDRLVECVSHVRVVDANQALVDILHADSRDQLMDVLAQHITSGPVDRMLELVTSVAEGRTQRSQEVETIAFDGSPLTLAVSTAVVRGFEGTFGRVLSSMTDITDLRRTERVLAETEAKFQAMASASQVALVFYDAEGQLRYMNSAAEELMGMTFEAARGNGWLDSIAPEDRDRVWTEFMDAIRDRRSYSTSGETIRPGGDRILWESNTAPVLIEDELMGYVDAIQDVTEHRLLVGSLERTQRKILAAHDLLTHSEAYFRAMADASPAGVFFYDSEANIEYVNRAGLELVGLTYEEVSGRGWERAIHPDDIERLKSEVSEALKAGRGYTGSARFVHSDGRVVWWDATAAPVVIEGESTGYVSVLQDVTSYRRAIQTARESQALLQSVLDGSPSMITIKSPDGIYLFANEEAARRLGLQPDQMVGLTLEEFLPGGVAKEIWAKDLEVIQSGEPKRIDEVYVNDDGNTVLDILRFPVTDSAGRVTALCAVATDITARVRVEEARRQERQAIAAEIHDDSVQVMASVGLRLETMARSLPEDQRERLAPLIVAVHDSIDRLRHLMLDLNAPVLEEEGLEAALGSLLREVSYQHEIAHAIHVDQGLEPSLVPRTTLFRVAREAIANAVKHSGATTIQLSVTGYDGHIELAVADDGAGFDTSTPSRSGHLGLLTMRSKVEQAGGTLRIESEPGRGTRVVASVPHRGTKRESS